ncbi:glycosyltransferase family 4 protein [Pelotomaculum isophthalicicum JI]|uniref:Glycosyltransferase family 4 protein n=1 Tax=Pelotomaculum isophthalicicum JI TaxID=947010 RepID=A0A9X4H168_9FIRM|nr:glycosyltransferase family 4 protein [Pelotomaculum isophthalicicum]MDF9407830.1 glycosyltransferase family 4 protein [Pelotomaculum isophthalicicum JI]
MRVLFLPTASWNDPPSRYRIHQYLDYLRGQGIVADCKAGVSDYIYARFTPYKGILAKAVFFGLSLLSRILACFIIWRYNAVFIQRLVLPHVYPLPEMLICLVAGLLGKRIIFDFDDAIFATSPHRKRTLVEKFTDSNRVARILARCDAVIAGNAYLADYARIYNSNVAIIPTSIDLSRYPVKKVAEKKPGEPYVIGWIGMPGSLPYLNILKPVFQEIGIRYKILIRIIGGQNYECPGVRVEHIPWSLKDEVSQILTFDMGVMPLFESEEARGKCGLKLLQYMAAGVPAVASPVSANNEIITDGINGYLAGSPEEWAEKLRALIHSTQLRLEMGRRGRDTVEQRFSIRANLPKLIQVITSENAALITEL